MFSHPDWPPPSLEHARNVENASDTQGAGPAECSPRANLDQPRAPYRFWIDQVQPRPDRAGDRLIGLAFAFGRIVSDPALHVQAGIWAAVDKRRHRAA